MTNNFMKIGFSVVKRDVIYGVTSTAVKMKAF